MPQSDSRATPAQREMQQAIEVFGEIALSLNALLQNQASLSGLMKANDAARFRNKVDALPKDSEERRDNNEIAEQRYGSESFAVFADEPHDFEILAQASRSAAIEDGGKIPAFAKALESERVVFVQRCDDLLEIAPSVRVRLRAHRQMFTDAEVSVAVQALEVVGVLRVNPWIVNCKKDWELAAMQVFRQLIDLLPKTEVDVHSVELVEGASSGRAQPREATRLDSMNPQDENGMFCPSDLAILFDVEYHPLRKRLERWRSQNKGSRDWTESEGRHSREPKYLYRLSAVKQLLSLDKVSSGRPSK